MSPGHRASRLRRAGRSALQAALRRRRRRPRLSPPFINAAANLARRQHRLRLRLLEHTAGFDISQTLISIRRAPRPTAARSGSGCSTRCWSPALGIVLATMLGFVIGIARLSRNWLVARLAGGYVELIRNMPLLLQMLFWYNAVLKALPELRRATCCRSAASSTIAACSCRSRVRAGLRRGRRRFASSASWPRSRLYALGAPAPGAHRRSRCAFCWLRADR